MPETYSHKPIPIFVLQHPRFSLADRVFLAYLMFANEEGVVFVSTRNIAILVGQVGEDGEPTDKDINLIRKARHALLARKDMVHFTKTTKRGRPADQYVIPAPRMTEGAVSLLSTFGLRRANPVAYRNAGWNAGSVIPRPEEPAGPTLEDGFDLDELIGDEVVEPGAVASQRDAEGLLAGAPPPVDLDDLFAD